MTDIIISACDPAVPLLMGLKHECYSASFVSTQGNIETLPHRGLCSHILSKGQKSKVLGTERKICTYYLMNAFPQL